MFWGFYSGHSGNWFGLLGLLEKVSRTKLKMFRKRPTVRSINLMLLDVETILSSKYLFLCQYQLLYSWLNHLEFIFMYSINTYIYNIKISYNVLMVPRKPFSWISLMNIKECWNWSHTAYFTTSYNQIHIFFEQFWVWTNLY